MNESRLPGLIRQARKLHGLTQPELAERVGAAPNTIRAWERGRNVPSLALRPKLAEILGISLQDLNILADTQELSREPQASEMNVHAVPMTPAPSSTLVPVPLRLNKKKRMNDNRRRMLSRVKAIWIGVLEHSLGQAALIVLGLRERPDALINPFHWLKLETDRPPRLLPEGTTLIEVFDDAAGELLILGEPGAGKTTALLTLLLSLLERALEASDHLIPVVFVLSEWARKKLPLDEWMEEELVSKYRLPPKLAREWVETNQLLPLLDGLDEMEEAARPACIAAINTYRETYDFLPMVISCRREEYFAQSRRLAMQQAIQLEPLSPEQIDDALRGAGRSLERVRAALHSDAELRAMITTPLLLHILMLAYQEEDAQATLHAGSLEERRKELFTAYVERMLQRGRVESHYTEADIKRWLSWLARQMRQHHQAAFYVERLQPGFLPPRERTRFYRRVVWLVNLMGSMVEVVLFACLNGDSAVRAGHIENGLLVWLGAPPGGGLLEWMAPGLGGGILGGGVMGLITTILALFIGSLAKIYSYKMEWTWKNLWRSVLRGCRDGGIAGGVLGMLLAVLFILFGGQTVSGGLFNGLAYGLLAGLMVGLTGIFLSSMSVSPSFFEVASIRGVGWRNRLADSLVIGVPVGVTFALVSGFLAGTRAIADGFGVFVFDGLIYFSYYALMNNVGYGLGLEIRPSEIISWSWEDIRQSLLSDMAKSLFLGAVVLMSVVIVIGGGSAIFYGWQYGLRYGSIYGIIVGCIVFCASLLTSMLNRGWSSDMLDQRQILQPNQGIRRSVRTSLFAAMLFGSIGALTGGLVTGAAFGFIGQLAGWPVLGLAFALIFGISFRIIFGQVYGGVAVLAHFLLRYALWRRGVLPWNYVTFLDFAVSRILLRRIGGGYMFYHRLILEYFASLDSP